jgi:hypothetical protein
MFERLLAPLLESIHPNPLSRCTACQGQQHTSNGHSTHNDAIWAAPCYGILGNAGLYV